MRALLALAVLAMSAGSVGALPPCETVYRLAADSDDQPNLWRPDGDGWRLAPWCAGDVYPVAEALRLQLLAPELDKARADLDLCGGQLTACELEAERIEVCEEFWNTERERRQSCEVALRSVVRAPHWTAPRIIAVIIAGAACVGGVWLVGEGQPVAGAGLLGVCVGGGLGAGLRF
ncbi:MAG: hypothetical protein ACI9MR_000048 [Myxococcota bacterium]|jgi:hypothetical protein